MKSFDAAFGPGAKNIAEYFVKSGQRARTAVTATMSKMNEWAAAGWSAIPYKQPIGISSAVGVGLAAVLSEPPPSMNLAVGFVQPDLRSGTGGRNIPQNVHPPSAPVGAPTPPNLTSMGNRAHVAPSFNVSISGRAMAGVDTRSIGNSIRNALGGQADINMRMTDQRRSLTAQSVADILSSG